MLIFWSILLVAIFGWRFWLRFEKERRRQLMITWPKRRPHFTEDDPDFKLQRTENKLIRWNYLSDQYTFFTQGEKYVGNKLVPEEFQMGVREAEEVETNLRLALESGSLRSHYNPADPTENFLAIGHTHLGWGKLLVYLVLGILMPVLLFYSYLAVSADPEVWWQTVTFINPAS